MLVQSIYITALILGGRTSANNIEKVYKYVAAFSIDGFHGSDVGKYVAKRPQSTIATLLETGYEYTAALTSGPSDSFPGTINLFTGASPRTTGVWYDNTYDRTFWPPYSTTGSNCSGPAGAEGILSSANVLRRLTQSPKLPMMKPRTIIRPSFSPVASIQLICHRPWLMGSVRICILTNVSESIQYSR